MDHKRLRLSLSLSCGIILPLLLLLILGNGSGRTEPVRAAPDAHDLSNGSVITIGVAGVLTGPYAYLGWQQVNAVQLAVSQTNDAGGIDVGGTPYSIAVAVADSACNGAQAITAANTLLDAGAVAVVGHTCSGASVPAASVYYTAGVPMITPSSTNPELTMAGYTTTFRTIPNDRAAAMKLAGYLFDTGHTRTAILIRNAFWSALLAESYQDAYTALGGNVVSSRTITSTVDITPALIAIQGEGVDVIVFTDPAGDMAGQTSRAAWDMGMVQPIASIQAMDQYIDLHAGPAAAEGDYGATDGRRISEMPGFPAFETAYVAADFAHEPVPGLFSPPAYDAANVIMEAIARANTPTDTLAIRDEIAATTHFTGVAGIYQGFDANGDMIPQWAYVDAVENGEWIPATVQTEIYADQGGTLDLEDTLGQTTTIDIPAGTTTETLVVTYTLVATVTDASVPTQTMVGRHAVRLEANVSISNPMTVTIEYDDEDVADVVESTLTFYTWDGSRWVDADPCGGYVRNLDDNVLQMIICHFSDYVMLGQKRHRCYLPLVLRGSP